MVQFSLLVNNTSPLPNALNMKQVALGKPKVRMFQEVLRCARERRCRSDEAAALADLAKAHLQVGEPAEAVQCLERALGLFHALGQVENEGLANELLCLACDATGDTERARGHLTRAIEIARAAGNLELLAARLGARGQLALRYGEPAEAVASLEEAIPLAERLGEDLTVGSLELMLAGALSDPRAVARHAGRALDVFRQMGLEPAVLNAKGALAQALAAQGEGARAIERWREMVAALEPRGAWADAIRIRCDIGQTLYEEGRGEEAARELEQAASLSRMHLRAESAEALGMLSKTFLKLGDGQRALGAIARALPVTRAQGDRLGESHLLYESALASAMLNQRARAEALYREALPLLDGHAEPILRGAARANLALLLMEEGTSGEAVSLLEQALACLTAGTGGEEDGEAAGLLRSFRELLARASGQADHASPPPRRAPGSSTLN